MKYTSACCCCCCCHFFIYLPRIGYHGYLGEGMLLLLSRCLSTMPLPLYSSLTWLFLFSFFLFIFLIFKHFIHALVYLFSDLMCVSLCKLPCMSGIYICMCTSVCLSVWMSVGFILLVFFRVCPAIFLTVLSLPLSLPLPLSLSLTVCLLSYHSFYLF